MKSWVLSLFSLLVSFRLSHLSASLGNSRQRSAQCSILRFLPVLTHFLPAVLRMDKLIHSFLLLFWTYDTPRTWSAEIQIMTVCSQETRLWQRETITLCWIIFSSKNNSIQSFGDFNRASPPPFEKDDKEFTLQRWRKEPTKGSDQDSKHNYLVQFRFKARSLSQFGNTIVLILLAHSEKPIQNTFEILHDLGAFFGSKAIYFQRKVNEIDIFSLVLDSMTFRLHARTTAGDY